MQEREKITKEFYKNEEIDDQGDGDDEEDQDFAIPSQFVGSNSDDNKVGGAEGSEIPSTPNSSAHPPDAPSNSGPAVPELPDIVPETAGEPDEILGDAATESFHLELEPDTEPMDTAGDIEKTIGELEETMGEPEDFIAGLVKEAPKAVSAEGVETHGGALENESETVEDKLPESESLRLVLEDDTEKPESDGEEMVCIDTSIIEAKEKKTSSLFASKRLAALGSEYDVSVLQKSLDTTPKLGAGFPGSDDLILDAPEPSKQEKGLSDLMDRFVKHAKASHKKHSGVRRKTVAKEVNLTIVRKERDADGNEQLKTEDISYTSTEVDLKSVDEAKKSEKPGAQHLALKQTLKEKIWAKKREERKKKEEQKRNQNGESFGDIEDEEEELLEDEFDDEENESEEEDSEENEEDEVEEDTEEIMKAMDAKQDKKKLRIKSAFADDEAQEEDVDEDELGNLALEDSDVNDDDKDSEGLPDTLQLASEEEEEEDAHEVTTLKKDSSTSVTQPPAGQTESGISASIGDSLPAFSQMEGESDIPRWTPFDERTSSLDVPVKDRDGTKAKKKLGFSGLLDDSDAPTDNLDDVIGLCSGQFATQNLQSFPDQTPDTVINTQSLTQSQLETQDTVILEPAISKEAPIDSNKALENEAEATHAAKFLDSDDEDVEQKKKTKKRKRIVMSDDSDDADSESKEFLDSDAEDNDGYEDEEDAMEKAVNYDSDENIVEEPQEFKGFKSKKGGLRKEFLEREAELSGSDVDSGDEDEKGLDRMEMEEGDLDDLDEDEVREQVEKIHQKQILDQDQREIKLFQEAFLEDGELHSDQARARKFKWLGAGKISKHF